MKKLTTVNCTLFSENLNDQIGEIHVNRLLSREDKHKALVELGLKKEDLRILYNGIYFNPITPIRVVTPRGKTYTFGTEIECFVSRDRIHETARANGVAIAYEHYNHEDGKDHYKFVSDSSVRSNNYEEDRNSIECVSPILKGKKGLSSLKAVCKSLNQAGATVNKNCGLHVHVGAKDLSDNAYINVFHNYKVIEHLIDSFMAPSRRGDENCYCHSIRRFNYENCHTKYDVYSLMGGRYFKVNPCAYNSHKTIEFRQHQGTTNYEKISMWVNFCVKLVEWSEKNIFTTAPASISEIPFLNAEEKAFFTARANSNWD